MDSANDTTGIILRLQNDNENMDERRCVVSLKNFTSSVSQHLTVDYVISGPILTVMILLGVVGNSMSIKILYNHGRRMAAINTFLIILAGWDLSLVISSFFLYNFSVLVNDHVVVHGEYVRAYPFLFVLTHASHTASIWCVVALAAERYFALCHPLKHRTKDALSRSRATLICLSAASLAASAPKYFEVLIVECKDADSGRTVPWVDSSPLRRHPVYSLVYIVVGGLLLHSLTPFLIMVILSIRVIVEVKRGATLRRRISARRTVSARSSNTMSSFDRVGSVRSVQSEMVRGGSVYSRSSFNRTSSRRRSMDKNDHVLAVAVVTKFLICHFLPTGLDICERLMNSDDFEGPIVDLLVDLSNVLVVLNSSINFLLYAICSVKFRSQVTMMMRCKGKEDADNGRRSLTSSMIKHSNSAEDRI